MLFYETTLPDRQYMATNKIPERKSHFIDMTMYSEKFVNRDQIMCFHQYP